MKRSLFHKIYSILDKKTKGQLPISPITPWAIRNT